MSGALSLWYGCPSVPRTRVLVSPTVPNTLRPKHDSSPTPRGTEGTLIYSLNKLVKVLTLGDQSLFVLYVGLTNYSSQQTDPPAIGVLVLTLVTNLGNSRVVKMVSSSVVYYNSGLKFGTWC